jgi:hypothetical protein
MIVIYIYNHKKHGIFLNFSMWYIYISSIHMDYFLIFYRIYIDYMHMECFSTFIYGIVIYNLYPREMLLNFFHVEY